MRLDKNMMAWTAGVVVISAVYLGLVTRSQMQRLSVAVAEVREEQAAAAGSGQIHDETRILQAQVDELAARLSRVGAQVPDDEQLGTLLEALSRHAQRLGLRADQVQPGKPIRSKRVVALPLSFTLHGPFQAMFELLKDIERLDRLTLIERFEARMTPESAGDVTAEVNLKVYYKAM